MAAAAAEEPFATVPEAILEEILLRMPSSASLLRAALVTKYWGRIISSPAFLSRYRKLHPSSPLLGFYSSDREFGLPAFRINASVRSDPDLKAVVRVADLELIDLEEDSGWRIRDSRNGHLLLCRAGQSGGDSFSIHNPVSRRLVTISADRPHDDVDYFADCLLLGDGDDDFRVVSVQQHGGQIRAVEYDPDARGWRSHPWVSPWPVDGPTKLKCTEPMYAAGLIFWTYSDTLAIVLDCSSMNFSMCPVPIRCWYAIGEIEDGMGCLVYIDEPVNSKTHGVLKVWLLTRNTGGGITWECSGKQIPVRELLGADARVRLVVRVTNGLALLSFNDQYDQFVVDLNKLSNHAEFDFHGRPYAYQMAWPSAEFAALQEICKEEAQPVQLVLPMEPAPPPHDVDFAAPNNDVVALNDDDGLAAPLHDIDVAEPIDDVGLAAPLHDGDAAAQIDDVSHTEGPSDVVLRPLDDCGTEHVIAAEANNLVGTVEDGVALMQTETAAPSADSVEGIPHSSSTPLVPHGNLGALSTQQPTTALDEHLHEDCPGECQHRALPTKPRCEEMLQPAGDVPEHMGQGHTISHTVNNFDLDAGVQDDKAKAKLATTGEVRVGMIERPNSSVPLEAGCEDSSITEEAQPVQLVLPVKSAPLIQMSICQMVDLSAPIAYEGPLDVVLRRFDLCGTEHVMNAEANNLVRTVEDGVRLMGTKAAKAAVPSADLVGGMTHSSEAISRKQRCEGVVSSFRVDPPLVSAPSFPPMDPASNNHSPSQFFDEATYTEKVKREAMYTQKGKNSEELPENSDELDHTYTPIDSNQNLNQGHESLTAGRQDIRLDAHPCEQELIESYLRPRVISGDKSGRFIHDSDVYAVHPADLTREYAAAVSRNGHQVWYFFTAMRARGDRRKVRTVDSGEGFWHTESKPKPVVSADQHLGYRRYLKFATKEGSRRVRSKWVMVELSLRDDGQDKVTLCKVYWSLHPAKKCKRKERTTPPAAAPVK